MPPVGEITRVLFNIVLMDIFNCELLKRLPGIAFSRFINEVFISTRENRVAQSSGTGFHLKVLCSYWFCFRLTNHPVGLFFSRIWSRYPSFSLLIRKDVGSFKKLNVFLVVFFNRRRLWKYEENCDRRQWGQA